MINLSEYKQYRLFHDASDPSKKDVRCYELRSKQAVLSPINDNQFEIWLIGEGSKSLKHVAKRTIKLDGEVVYIFDNKALPQCLDNVRWRRKRVITDNMRQRGKTLANLYGFRSHK